MHFIWGIKGYHYLGNTQMVASGVSCKAVSRESVLECLFASEFGGLGFRV